MRADGRPCHLGTRAPEGVRLRHPGGVRRACRGRDPGEGPVRPSSGARRGHGVGGRFRARQPQGRHPRDRHPEPGHAQGARACALDLRLLLLPGGDGSEERPSRFGAQGGGRLARTPPCACIATAGRVPEVDPAAGDHLADHRGMARTSAPRTAAVGRDHGGDRPQARGQRLGADRSQGGRARPLREGTDRRDPASSAERPSIRGAGQDHRGDRPAGAEGRPRRRRSCSGVPAPWRHQFRQDGGLSPGHRPCAGAGQGSHRAGARDRAHAADGRAVQGPVLVGTAADLGGGAAFASEQR